MSLFHSLGYVAKSLKLPTARNVFVLVAVVILGVYALQTFVARPYVIPSGSMEPTLHGCPGCTGDRIVAERASFWLREPQAGDVVVFVGPPSWNDRYQSIRSDNPVVNRLQEEGAGIGLVPPDENDLVKRIIALGGQTVECCDIEGRVMVDGKGIDEPYVENDVPWKPGGTNASYPAGRVFPQVKVPEGHMWVMGDNRARSADSRYHMEDELMGTVPLDNVRGRVPFRFWPPSRIGAVN
jgi:signal peptidase I